MNNTFVITLKPDQQVRAMEKFCYALREKLTEAKPELRFSSYFYNLYYQMVREVLIQDNILCDEKEEESDENS